MTKQFGVMNACKVLALFLYITINAVHMKLNRLGYFENVHTYSVLACVYYANAKCYTYSKVTGTSGYALKLEKDRTSL